jgi:hypothetical protein
MGRPLRNDVLGTDVRGSYANPNAGIRCSFHNGSLRTDGVVVKQRGAKTFVVTRIGDLGDPNIKDSTSTATCVLVEGTPATSGEMQILGATNDQVPGTVAIAKLTKRVATDFSGNRYTWYLENDSTADIIRLTAI